MQTNTLSANFDSLVRKWENACLVDVYKRQYVYYFVVFLFLKNFFFYYILIKRRIFYARICYTSVSYTHLLRAILEEQRSL